LKDSKTKQFKQPRYYGSVVANLKQIEAVENKDETHRGKKTQIYNKQIEKCQRTKMKPTKEKNPDLQQTT
jgi:hypothetical protein